jgi:hypothetical protein
VQYCPIFWRRRRAEFSARSIALFWKPAIRERSVFSAGRLFAGFLVVLALKLTHPNPR